MRKGSRWLGLAVLSVSVTVLGDVACSATFVARACDLDADCGDGRVCVAEDQTRVCTTPDRAPIRIGQSAPASGPSQDLGLEMRRGLDLAFDEANAAGGVRGRPLSLEFLDDQYTPDLAQANARTLVDAQPASAPPRCPTTMNPPVAGQSPFAQSALLPGPNAVTSVIGSVGTPTMVVSAPIIVETGTLYFGAFTGATTMIRDTKAGPCDRFIFNVRASYAEEARATLEYFLALKVPDDKHLVSFDQNDTFGDAGYSGLVAAYEALEGKTPSVARFRYTRDDVDSVPAQATAAQAYLRALLAADESPHTVGVMMTDTYGAGTQFIHSMKDWLYANDADQTSLKKATRLTIYFSNLSFVGPNSLSDRLKELGTVATPSGPKPYTDGVFVSQVVPNYDSDSSDLVLAYKKRLAAAGAAPTFTSLEGYIDGRLFIEGLKNAKGQITTESLVTSFETLPPLDLGLGASAGFSPTSHQYSKSVYGTALGADGGFENVYFWSDGAAIQLYQ